MRVVRVETDLQKVPKSLWIQDYKSNACNVCTNSIKGGWIKSNKHHCRYCGHIVCASCSDHAVFESKSNYHRICDICYQNKVKSEPENIKQTINNSINPITKTLQLSTTNKPSAITDIDISTAIILDYNSSSSLNNNDNKSPDIYNKGYVRENKRRLTIDYQMNNNFDTEVSAKPFWINRRDILVTGYIHRYQQEKQLKIPQDIINMIISWSFINDIWQKYDKSTDDHIKISMSSQTMERISDNNQHCYYSFGHDIIHKNSNNGGIKEWRLRLDKVDYYTNNYCSMIIGIAETSKINWIQSLLGDFTYGVYKGYGLRIATKPRFVHQHSKQQIYLKSGNLRKGDIIKITLDLSGNGKDDKYGKLGFYFENECGEEIEYGIDAELNWMGFEKGIAFNNINRNKRYSLVVGMYCKDKVTFLEKCNC